MTEIRNLHEFLINSLPINAKIKRCITKPLTKPGDNYGGILLSVEVEVKNVAEKKETTMYLVAKMCPTNEIVKKLFQISTTFKREIAMYHTIFPTLVEFQQEQGVSNVARFLPKYYDSRTSLNEDSTVVDDDAVILLENLNFLGFEVVDKLKGFDLDTAKLILKELAIFHAIPIAVRMMKPSVFKCKIEPYVHTLTNLDAPVRHLQELEIKNIIEAAKLNPQCHSLIPKVENAIRKAIVAERASYIPREPFVTLCHNDFWINNIMVKFVDTKPLEIKFLDFQFIQLLSPCNDVTFFLYTSVQFNVIKNYFNELISCYHDSFIGALKSLKCDIQQFSYESFQQELKESAKDQFWHILRRVPSTFVPDGKFFNFDKLIDKDQGALTFLPQYYYERMSAIILHFEEKNWL